MRDPSDVDQAIVPKRLTLPYANGAEVLVCIGPVLGFIAVARRQAPLAMPGGTWCSRASPTRRRFSTMEPESGAPRPSHKNQPTLRNQRVEVVAGVLPKLMAHL